MPGYVLDTSLLLGGKEPPLDGPLSTTPEAAAEIRPGGRDARRFDHWIAKGLVVRSATATAEDKVHDVAMAAGNLGRLSAADVSLVALAWETKAILVTDDHTMLDVARRLGLTTRTINTQGITSTMDFQPRCMGCGRWFDAMPKKEECTVCGSPVHLKPKK